MKTYKWWQTKKLPNYKFLATVTHSATISLPWPWRAWRGKRSHGQADISRESCYTLSIFHNIHCLIIHGTKVLVLDRKYIVAINQWNKFQFSVFWRYRAKCIQNGAAQVRLLLTRGPNSEWPLIWNSVSYYTNKNFLKLISSCCHESWLSGVRVDRRRSKWFWEKGSSKHGHGKAYIFVYLFVCLFVCFSF